MDTKTEEMVVDAIPNQFWGAIKIFTEKPHVINRRICGTTNLWIGVCEERNYSQEKVLTSVLDAVQSDSNDGEEHDVQESTPENNINPKADCENINTGRKFSASDETDCEMQKSALEIRSENHVNSETNCENAERGRKFNANISHTKLSLIQKKLEDGYFKSFASYDVMKAQDGHEASENDNNDDNDDEDDKAIPRDDDAEFQDGRKASETNNNDDNADEDETATETCHQNALPDRQEGKLSIPWEYLTKTSNTIAVVRKILPKQADKFASVLEVILLDGARKVATYITETRSSQPSINPKVNYSISLTSSGIRMSCLCGSKQEGDSSVTWLTKNVLPKVVKWASEVSVDGLVDDRGSLRLVDVAEYNEVYQRLKIKYGKPLVKMWPEVTDPLKFVYEDIAIATYLILLWGQERQQKGLSSPQSFVDLGCGNGLLVYILSGEGHKGLGIDVKKRKIWDLFPSHIELKEDVIEPSDKNLFPEYDWLIGNHSDELTPWIPVIAAKSDYHSRFFVIPCCAHDFSQKYRRRHAGRSQYSDYLEYVKEIGAVCGFNVKQDKLRIPSTKRICLVGDERTVDASTYSKLSESIDGFIKERTEVAKQLSNEVDVKSNAEPPQNSEQDGLSTTNMWTENFKARECVQPVRNCTQLKRSVREDIISAIVGVLMEKKHLVEVDIENSETQTTITWDRGGSMALGDLAKRLDRPLLAAMKRECGGLQTLLKNHRYIFNLSDGLVSLQVPQPAWKKKVTLTTFTKTKLCWFHTHHRSGCPLPSKMCMFAHGEGDLRSKGGS